MLPPHAVPTEAVPVTVVGSGSWGTALAIHAARRGHPTVLWSRRPEQAAAMKAERRNPRYLQEFGFPDGLEAASELGPAVARASLVILAVPSHGMRGILRQIRETSGLEDARRPVYLIAAKGVEVDTLAPMIKVAEEELPGAHVTVLGGPSFAAEVAAGQPTTVVVAGEPLDAGWVQRVISGAGVRAYVTEDAIGVELGGAFKNVVAIAAGMCDGAGFGLNARAGLITRGLAEIGRLATALGADPATLAGLSGLGDLVLTCTGGLSRNRRVGVALGEGRTLEEVLDEMGMVAEGIKNTQSAYLLARREGLDMPIVETMHEILYGGMTVRDAVASLMGRSLRHERD